MKSKYEVNTRRWWQSPKYIVAWGGTYPKDRYHISWYPIFDEDEDLKKLFLQIISDADQENIVLELDVYAYAEESKPKQSYDFFMKMGFAFIDEHKIRMQRPNRSSINKVAA